MDRVCALVLTYNRKQLVGKTIAALASQSVALEKIFVINNACTDGTERVLAETMKKYPKGLIEVVTLKENLGASGGFSEGMKYFLKHSRAGWLWMMDDDAVPEKRALEKFQYYYRQQPEKKRKKIGILQNERVLDSKTFRELKIPLEAVREKRIFRATFEGYCVKREVMKTIGFPRAEFFIYSDDIEYTWRVIGGGYRVYRVLGSLINHRDWAKLDKVRRGLIAKPNIAPWKLYYRFRNVFLVCEKQPVFRFFLRIFLSLDMLLWAFIKKENAYFAKLGIADGVKLVSGKTVTPDTVPVINK